MPRITKAMLQAENADLKRRLEENNAAYWAVTERLQALCELLDCPAGADRVTFLRARLGIDLDEQRGKTSDG